MISCGYLSYLNNIIQVFINKDFRGWGKKRTGKFACWCQEHFGGKVTLLEDGFIRSLGLGVDGSPSFSIVEDDIGIYYDATTSSKLESILNNYDFYFDLTLIDKAREAMDLIKKHHISKYNNAPNIDQNYFTGDRNKKILIIAQTYGDASLKYGLGHIYSTDNMIDDAIKENSSTTVYIKIHPDVLSGKKKSDIDVNNIPKECKVINSDVNPISLLKYFDKVYTKTSGMGMEALILGLEVHCYGMPYYAGWGLTIDKQTSARRSRKLTLEELFLGTYMLYTRYYNPYKKRDCDIIETIKEIVTQKKML